MIEDKISRGKRAEMIIKDALWTEAWDTVRARITAAMIAAKTDEGTLRGKQLLALMVDLRQHWERAIKDGQIAEYQIKLDAEEKKRRFWQRAA